jgi:hypothetical protein
VLYSLLVIAVALSAFLARFRIDGIFACSAQGYSSDRYLAYCNATLFGDYEHGAFWFGLEPQAAESASAADVLFLGNSRLQYAFSTKSTERWFEAARLAYYQLGFSYYENVTFARPLLESLHPRAAVYVINVDRFFDDQESDLVKQLFDDPFAKLRYRIKGWWQTPHRLVCGSLPALCGQSLALFRSRGNGSWLGDANGFEGKETAIGPPTEQERWSRFQQIAKDFVDSLPVDRSCVLLTIVPTTDTRLAEASGIANALEQPLFVPPIEGLRTFDGSHLDAASAERWSKAFLETAGAQIGTCAHREKLTGAGSTIDGF